MKGALWINEEQKSRSTDTAASQSEGGWMGANSIMRGNDARTICRGSIFIMMSGCRIPDRENAPQAAQDRFEETSRHRTAPAAILGRDGGNKDNKADHTAFPCS